MEKFSVLLSVYYKENPEYLKEAMCSIFNQTVEPTEVVLVKDGLLNEALDSVIQEFKRKYSSLKVISLPKNVGLGNALNEGLKYCSYEFVARMDSDDICMNDRFEKQLITFAQNKDIDVVGGWVNEFIDTISNVISIRKLPQSPEELMDYAKYRNPLNHPSVMYKKSSVMASGGYKHFYLLEDYYLWCRMLLNGAKFYNIQEPILSFRSSENMFNRRGGIKYAIAEVKFFKFLYVQKFISLRLFLKNIIIRFTVRIMPNKIRKLIYTKLLRE